MYADVHNSYTYNHYTCIIAIPNQCSCIQPDTQISRNSVSVTENDTIVIIHEIVTIIGDNGDGKYIHLCLSYGMYMRRMFCVYTAYVDT